jgi:hypothetical protein
MALEDADAYYVIARFRGSGVQGFRGSGVQRFRGSGVQGFRGSGVQGFRGSAVRFPGSGRLSNPESKSLNA